jgi:hypothetical protein
MREDGHKELWSENLVPVNNPRKLLQAESTGIWNHAGENKKSSTTYSLGRLDYKDRINCWVLVAHACNPHYSEGSDQEDRSSKSAQANSSRDPILKKKPFTKIGLVEWLKVKALSSSPSMAKIKR